MALLWSSCSRLNWLSVFDCTLNIYILILTVMVTDNCCKVHMHVSQCIESILMCFQMDVVACYWTGFDCLWVFMFCVCGCLVCFLIAGSNDSKANSINAWVYIDFNAKTTYCSTKATEFSLNLITGTGYIPSYKFTTLHSVQCATSKW